MPVTLNYILSLVIAFTAASRMSAQCMKMAWIDDELNTHGQPYKLYFLPDVSYRFYNEEYKIKKVAGVKTFNETKDFFYEKRFDTEGYLQYEKSANPEGGFILHHYRYRDSRRIVEDSMQYVIYTLKRDSATGNFIEPADIDTMLVYGLKTYNTDGKLVTMYTKLSKNYKWEFQKSLGFFADSLFFYYDSCANLVHTDWYTGGMRNSASSNYNFSGLNIHGENQVQIYNSMINEEYWIYNEKDQLMKILSEREVITLEYKNNRVSRNTYISSLDPWGRTYTTITEYYYDSKGQVMQVLKKFEEEERGKQKKGKKDKGRIIRIKRDKNGLPLVTFEGNEIKYIYR